ncbi:MAG: glycosyltransferase family protein [Chloroflexi bacterium]|nr:glycosyltransferase family protein [Chloroflexota bacterium]
MKIAAIIQARMSSSRLPGKVLLDLAGQPMLARVVERTRRARTVSEVIVATTTDLADDAVEAFCLQRGYACRRGSLHDVLDRYYQAARLAAADAVVRITADCPVIDPQVVDKTVNGFLSGEPPYDFAANRLPPPWGRTYPIGLDTEVCTFAALETAWREAVLPHQREHVMPFFYDNPQRFRVLHVNHDVDYGALRWTVDTAEDLEMLRQIFARFDGRDDFSWLDVLALLEREPQLAQINAAVQHKQFRAVDHRFHVENKP